MPVITWINGGFGKAKTTLAEDLYRRLPAAVVYDPDDVGLSQLLRRRVWIAARTGQWGSGMWSSRR